MMPAGTRRKTRDQAWHPRRPWTRQPLAFSQPGMTPRIFICFCGAQAVVSNGEPPTGWIEQDGRHVCPDCWRGRAA